MRKFYQAIVNNPKKILVCFLLMAVIGAVLRGMVGVNYDMTDYLPEDTASTVSLEVLEEEFEGGIPNARVMVKNVTIPEALEYKEKILTCEGVTDVTWLDDAADILQPIETMDTDTVETYYKDNAALFSVVIEDGRQVEAVDAIRNIVGEDNALTGDAVSTAAATTGTVAEINLITVIAIVFVFVVLVITTTSWIEPVLVMLGLGIAVMINSGSNLIFGEISFVTNAAGTILQIAVSLDYSVFLIHRFEECLKENPNPKEAMVDALCKSTSSILSSGLTTVIGFLALVFMQFRIGPDLGLALAKGVAISLITVFTFMPVLILVTQKWLIKTRHRKFLPSFRGFGKLIYRVMVPLVCVFVVLIVPSYLASNANEFYYGSSQIYGGTTQYGQDTAAIEELYGKSDTYVAMVPRGDLATEQELSDALHDIPQVKSILSYVDTVGAEIPMEYLDADIVSQLVSENYSRFVITVDADYEGEETFSLVETIRDTVNSYYPDSYYLAGTGVSTYDLMDTITVDTVKVNLIAIGAVFVVLLLTMKSISLPIILVLAIETAIWINVAIPYFQGSVVFYISYLIISSIQLGATVDYAILFTERYTEFRTQMGKKQAVVETVVAVMPSVITSGSVLAVVGYLLGYISSHGILSQLGIFVGRGSLLSLAIVLFVLPGLLYLLDGVIQRTTLNLHFYKAPKEEK
jgi:predicted RND superfamily exporter protein